MFNISESDRIVLVAETREAATLQLPRRQHYIVVCGGTSVKVYVP